MHGAGRVKVSIERGGKKTLACNWFITGKIDIKKGSHSDVYLRKA